MSQSANCPQATDLHDGNPIGWSISGGSASWGTAGTTGNSSTIRFTMGANQFSLASDCVGVLVAIDWYADSASPPPDTIDVKVQLVSGGVQVGNQNKATNSQLPTTLTLVDYGGSTDVWGFAGSIPKATVNDTTFGVDIQVDLINGFDTAHINHVNVTVYDASATDDTDAAQINERVMISNP